MAVRSHTIPLHLITFAIISPFASPLYVHSYTGQQDELRYHHIAHAALDIIEEREQNPARQLDNYLGLLFSMDDLAVYGYRTASRLRIVVSLGLIDGIIKDSDVVTICRTIHQIYTQSTSNPFLLLSSTSLAQSHPHPNIPHNPSLISQPEQLPPLPRNEDLKKNKKMREGAEKLGRLLDGGRGR